MNRLDESDLPEEVLDDAARWHLRCDADHDMDWDAFTLWLEADPRHQRAFDELALTASALSEHRDLLSQVAEPETNAVNAFESASRRRFPVRWAGMAIAASLIAALALPRLASPPPRVYTTSGTTQRVVLADGSSVMLAPRSLLSVEGRGQEHIALTGGALFDIRHDPSRHLSITAGDLTISDIGTRFDVQATDRTVRIAVGEGQVEVSAHDIATPIAVTAGEAIAYDARAGTVALGHVSAADIGAWRDGRLSYEDAPLTLVVADLHRYAGIRVEVPATLQDRRFSGTLIVDDGQKTLRDLAQLMDLRVVGGPGAWRLEPR